MKLHPLLIVACFLIVGACSHKVVRVDDEFLREMSPEEIQQMERIEKAIVAISDEQQPIRDSIRITELELQIQKRESVQLEREKSILNNKDRLYKLKNDFLKQKEAQQAIQHNSDKIALDGLRNLVLKARLANDNACLEMKSAELAEKISQRSLMRAQIGRAQQDKVFGTDSGKSVEKIRVSNFEKRLEEKQLTLQKKENLRLEAGNKYQEARSALNQKMLWMSALQFSPIEVEATDELKAESAIPEVMPTLIRITQLEIQVLQQEKEQLQRKSSILVDRKRVSKLKNNSIEQTDYQQDIEKTAKEIYMKELLVKAMEARLVYENTQAEKQQIALEQKNTEKVLAQAQMKRKLQDEALGDNSNTQKDKIDLSDFENQLKKIQSRLQMSERSILEAHGKFKEAFNDWKDAQSKTD
ncbi:hypothetical protein KJ966_25950 [bacterium]|nr:hypothetical protein [bacterium]